MLRSRILGFWRRHRSVFEEAITRADDPIRAEIFSAERMEQHARSLALMHLSTTEPRFEVDLTQRFHENVQILREAYDEIGKVARAQWDLTPAAEWLLDNFHVIEEHIAEVRSCVGQIATTHTLPCLSAGTLEGNPRIYGIVWDFVAHIDSRLAPELLIRFIAAYQSVQPLEMRELWATPLALRLVLIENLRRLAAGIVRAQRGRERAHEYADQLEAHATDPGGQTRPVALPSAVTDPAFLIQLRQRLRYYRPDAVPVMESLGGWLAHQHIDWDELVQRQHAAQGAANLTVSNIVGSLRMIAAYDWQTYFERVSLVEMMLRETSTYVAMDFLTRDRYRHAIEELASRSPLTELEVARKALQAAGHGRKPALGAAAGGSQDPGHLLIGTDRCTFEAELGYRPLRVQTVSRLLTRYPARFYLGGVGVLTLAVLAGAWVGTLDAPLPWQLVLLFTVLAVFPASDLAVALMNRVVSAVFEPRHLPRLNLAAGIPDDLRTFVVVPTVLRDEHAVREQVRELEVHYLANPDGAVHFALLSDWADAASEQEAQDEALLRAAAEELEVLNGRHPAPSGTAARFFLFHRRRLWNAGEQRWMGWERKRGKLHEFNRLLRGARDTSYIALPGDAEIRLPPPNVRYVLTLDADTRLPMDAVQQLVGTAAHWVNAPRFDPESGRIVEGYAIFQPRISPLLPRRSERSIFRTVFTSAGGIDPYAGAVSDAYQDLFGEGSFTGKGLYDVDAFERAIAGRIPVNAVLSHDLFESLFARCALVGDVELFEDFPSHAEVAAVRAHRWVRGDWQLIPWALGRRGRGLPAIGRWKLIDNLRRSLVAPAAFLLLVLAWSVSSIAVDPWLALILVTFATPGIIAVSDRVLADASSASGKIGLRALGDGLLILAGQVLSQLIFLAQNAWVSIDAITRTLVRVLFTRRRMLEWVTAAQVKSESSLTLAGFGWFLRAGTILVIGACATVLYFDPPALLVAAPVVALWWLAPLFARLMSTPPSRTTAQQIPGDSERLELRLIARRTWRFFAEHVGAEDNHLPPDNVQEDPQVVVAHRSSPTNFGLYLLSVIAARDFGWLSLSETVSRLERTFATLMRLERYRGHFWNWYDTRSLQPLLPKYVSTVDSGNLAAHLLVVGRACEELCDRSVFDARVVAGIEDAVCLLAEALEAVPDNRRTVTVTASELQSALQEFRAYWQQVGQAQAPDWSGALADLTARAEHLYELARILASERSEPDSEALAWAQMLHETLRSHAADLRLVGENAAPDPGMQDRLRAIAGTARKLFAEVEFGILFDRDRHLFSIGGKISESSLELDGSYYDLLASEARIASFVAIAKREVPKAHWFRLGRRLTLSGGRPVLMSWSGSMFEYLMPSLVLYTPHGTLLDQTCRAVIARHIAHGEEHGIPWGVSESAFNMRDHELTYQYSAFGVPGLGLKRGLGQQLVIAPYATALAAQYDVRSSLENFRRLRGLGALGRYGFYDAIDYTASRRPEDKDFVLVRTFMAHHQGMTLTALANVVCGAPLRHRFHREPIVQAADLLLQESTTLVGPIVAAAKEAASPDTTPRESTQQPVRRFTSWQASTPVTHLLSNGRYGVMLTTTGSGSSVWNRIAVSRWREDPTRDDWGSYIYLRDRHSGAVWSAGYQPTGAEPDRYEVRFSEDRARFARSDHAIDCALEIIVSPEDDVELRRLVLTNTDARERELEITSFSEVVLCPQQEDLAHPAFAKLFVETEYFAPARALIARRRPRASEDSAIWAAHVIAIDTGWAGEIEYETDRRAFLGRGRTVRAPLAVIDGRPLSNTTGHVLDPMFSLRTRIRLGAGATVRVTFGTMVADKRDTIEMLADKYHDPSAFERASALSWTHAQVRLHHLGITPAESRLFQQLASHVLFSNAALRPGSEFMASNTLGHSTLWRWGLSGDLPFVLLRVATVDDRDMIDQLLRAHEFWLSLNLAVDLVILNDKPTSYLGDVQQLVDGMVQSSALKFQAARGPRGGVYVLRADDWQPQELVLLACAARAVLVAGRGSLAQQVRTRERAPLRVAEPAGQRKLAAGPPPQLPNMSLYNGLGGFVREGREYAVVLTPGKATPAPWINVIANPGFGFIVSESGCGYTWCGNSRLNQLTPWSNDPISDSGGEALYLRDVESGDCWSPTAAPLRIGSSTYVAYHGFGYSRFEHQAHGISSHLLHFMPLRDPIRIVRLHLRNDSPRKRAISVYQYIEWALGASRGANAHLIATAGPETGFEALRARNPWNEEYAQAVAFVSSTDRVASWTCDRREFLGHCGSLARPAAVMTGEALSGRSGAGIDPCALLAIPIEIEPRQTREVVFFIGQGADDPAARALLERYRTADLDAVFAQVEEHWQQTLGKVQVTTPEPSMNVMLNGWLLYQTLSCRVWGRSAFYQAGGAYGFRDQLQDSLALVLSAPGVVREHLLRAAGRQFPEGDVQHWWHPPSGRGVRTHFSDDRAWLAYAVEHYVRVSGDHAVLDEQVAYLEGPPLEAGQESSYFLPTASARRDTLYEHCALALDASLSNGPHGLPLMGCGDWNDGMNRVGQGGRGESVWLGWFLYTNLTQFAAIARSRNDADRAQRWLDHARQLQRSIEDQAWDGAWYRRAYFDDGTALGSSANDECRIDAIAQSWALISGAADPDRARRAMESLENHLLRPGDELALLFTPPFDRTRMEPGYIKAYPPGVRENGGQYTHASVWTLIAFTLLGDGDQAGEVFEMLNPAFRTASRTGIHAYKAEPYAVAGDVYAAYPHTRQGGWSWYTGAAGWLYRAGIEWMLGLRLTADRVRFAPCIPRHWSGFSARFQHGSTMWQVRVDNPQGVMSGIKTLAVDGVVQAAGTEAVDLDSTRTEREIAIVLG